MQKSDFGSACFWIQNFGQMTSRWKEPDGRHVDNKIKINIRKIVGVVFGQNLTNGKLFVA
jgi:hypothetical protein